MGMRMTRIWRRKCKAHGQRKTWGARVIADMGGSYVVEKIMSHMIDKVRDRLRWGRATRT